MSTKMSYNEQLLVSKIDLVDYYNKYIATLGGRFRPIQEGKAEGICPFHQDTDPSLHHWKKKNIFHCFGCGWGGNIVKVHMGIMQKYHGQKMTPEQAMEDLGKLWGIELLPEDSQPVQNVFARAKELMGDKKVYVIPKGTFNLAEFRQLNNKVKLSNISLDIKVANFEQLDLVASVALTNQNG